ncbi:DUF5071 domain-containing protein [Vannielia litorea]|uniref:DUF5071 domain-containing protein n=1 Tax=Vannielia litorea TaxID=1217970 RepID=UPI001C98CB89|nr:DUF5071 domain-containing protein [Vannielia litorea]MBY6046679.1 DUF5071 domain-containing protein [Vannielia litorea]MBY6074093.1 DUF5071 domain-containing protein [Vannielia litorea]
MSANACLPTDKHDIAAVHRAAALAPEARTPLLPGLLEWVQDANWPVARPVADLLVAEGAALLPHLRVILQSEDAVWKYWLIELVIARLPPPDLAPLRPLLERLATAPGSADRAEEVHLAARAALAPQPG